MQQDLRHSRLFLTCPEDQDSCDKLNRQDSSIIHSSFFNIHLPEGQA
ncbi:hypothetical protein D1AOALGA4SA_10373 [Olavius algarvensis Delta 1 endosymbiont]|nr:hypothetical protein D1AOALGA4SA_10373 [Olavius algarvensis Delta 1 endosymbiont]